MLCVYTYAIRLFFHCIPYIFHFDLLGLLSVASPTNRTQYSLSGFTFCILKFCLLIFLQKNLNTEDTFNSTF